MSSLAATGPTNSAGETDLAVNPTFVSTGAPPTSGIPRNVTNACGKLLPSSWLQNVIVTAACAGTAAKLHTKKAANVKMVLIQGVTAIKKRVAT
jgi:hypothetical protein